MAQNQEPGLRAAMTDEPRNQEREATLLEDGKGWRVNVADASEVLFSLALDDLAERQWLS